MKHAPITVIMLLIPVILLWGCHGDEPGDPVALLQYNLTGSYPHDTLSFTEGLLIYHDTLFESTGSPYFLPRTRSVFGPVDLATGQISVKVELDKELYFGEGIACLHDKFYQLTYQNKTGFVYNAATYEMVGQFSYLSDEAWGLTTDSVSLIMSDGTDRLIYIDPNTFLVSRILYVTEKGAPKRYLNELEYIRGYIFANIWLSSTVAKIDPASGEVTALIGLSDLQDRADSLYAGSGEMNGIAYDPASDMIYLTGKLWPEIYRIKLVE